VAACVVDGIAYVIIWWKSNMRRGVHGVEARLYFRHGAKIGVQAKGLRETNGMDGQWQRMRVWLLRSGSTVEPTKLIGCTIAGV